MSAEEMTRVEMQEYVQEMEEALEEYEDTISHLMRKKIPAEWEREHQKALSEIKDLRLRANVYEAKTQELRKCRVEDEQEILKVRIDLANTELERDKAVEECKALRLQVEALSSGPTVAVKRNLLVTPA